MTDLEVDAMGAAERGSGFAIKPVPPDLGLGVRLVAPWLRWWTKGQGSLVQSPLA